MYIFVCSSVRSMRGRGLTLLLVLAVVVLVSGERSLRRRARHRSTDTDQECLMNLTSPFTQTLYNLNVFNYEVSHEHCAADRDTPPHWGLQGGKAEIENEETEWWRWESGGERKRGVTTTSSGNTRGRHYRQH